MNLSIHTELNSERPLNEKYRNFSNRSKGRVTRDWLLKLSKRAFSYQFSILLLHIWRECSIKGFKGTHIKCIRVGIQNDIFSPNTTKKNLRQVYDRMKKIKKNNNHNIHPLSTLIRRENYFKTLFWCSPSSFCCAVISERNEALGCCLLCIIFSVWENAHSFLGKEIIFLILFHLSQESCFIWT